MSAGRLHPPNRRVAPRRPPSVDEDVPDAFEGARAIPDEGAARVRRAKIIEGLRTAAGVALVAGCALACVMGLVRYTRGSPRFAIRTIEVHGGARRSDDDVLRTAGIAAGQNVFSVDLDAARSRLLADAWVERATLSRRLPGTVRIEIVEREAAALAPLGGDLLLVTRDGEPFKRLEPGDPYDFPVVTGLDSADLTRDRAAVTGPIKRALDFAAEWDRTSVGKRAPVQEAHVGGDGSLDLVVGKEGVTLRMGKGPVHASIEQAARVLAEVQARRGQAEMVFVDNEAHPERVVVRMR